jgi:hypothetical protein
VLPQSDHGGTHEKRDDPDENEQEPDEVGVVPHGDSELTDENVQTPQELVELLK